MQGIPDGGDFQSITGDGSDCRRIQSQKEKIKQRDKGQYLKESAVLCLFLRDCLDKL